MRIPECVEVEVGREPEASVVWLHGLGADGHDFEPLVPELALHPDLRVRFVFPHAPMRPVTINGGMTMRAWYDIMSLDRTGPQDEDGIRESARLLEDLVEREHERGSGYGRIVVAGFSQGGAIALHMALRYRRRLAGLAVLSSWLPLADTLEKEISEESRSLPIFMAHGTYDPMLPISLGQDSKRRLEQAGFQVEWHEYPMQHAVCGEEIAELSRWLNETLGTAG